MSLNMGSLDISRQLLKVDTLEVDAIIEKTLDQGINIDSLIIKDEGFNYPTNDVRLSSISNEIKVTTIDEIAYRTLRVTTLITNIITERSLDVGITIDGLVIKDEGINFPTNDIRLLADITDRLALRNIANDAFSNLIASEVRGVNNIKTDTILERNADQGVNIDGVVIKDNDIALIASRVATHKAIAGDHHAKYSSSDLETSLGVTVAKLLKSMVYGSANKIFIACASIVLKDGAFSTTVVKTMVNLTTSGGYVMYSFPKPTNKNGLKLHIKDIRVILALADIDNKISTIWLMGVNVGGSVTEIDFDVTNLYPAGTHTWSRGSATDVSAYSAINIHIFADNADIGALEIMSVLAEYYYE